MSSSNKSNASDLFVKALENEGVEFIFGIPGEENLDLLEALSKSKIKLILNRHEQAGGFMAATYARMTGKVGVAFATLGPGATNFTTAAAYATLGGFPVLFITGQKPINQSKQGAFQIIDVVSMMRPITKYSKQITNVSGVTTTVREAFRNALEEKPGAVHIEFPEDVSAEEVTSETNKVLNVSKVYHGSPSVADIKEIAKLIKSAKQPMVLIGSACSRYDIKEHVTNFINKTKLMFVTTQMGKGVVSEDNEGYIGTCALSSSDYVHEAIKNADVIINIGYDVVEKPPYFVDFLTTKVIHINYFSAKVDAIYNPALELLGSIPRILDMLGDELSKCNVDYTYAIKVKKFLESHIKSHENDNSFPIKPQKAVLDINKVMGEKGVLALDNGMYKLWFARNYKSLLPNTVLLDNALATMGAGLPSAMEIARLYPEKKVLAVVGDGGFMMNSQELETAVRLGLSLVVLILNDSGYGMIRWKQDAAGFKDYGLEFKNPDFVKYAESYGVKGYRVEKTEDFLPLLEKSFKEKGITLIDLPIDYSENRKVFTEELQNKKKI